MTSVALTSLIAPLLQAKASAGNAQRMTGFGILLGTRAELEAVSFGQIFAQPVLPATKMPFHSDNFEALDAARSEGAGTALEEVLVNPTVTMPALTEPEVIGFEQVKAPPALPTTKTLLLSDSADMLEGAHLKGAETPQQATLVDPVEQVTVAAKETISSLQPAEAVEADVRKLVVGESGNSGLIAQAAVSVAPKSPRPHLPSATAQVTLQIGPTTAALSAGLEPELSSSFAVSLNQVTVPTTEVTQLVAATSGPLGKVLPKQTAELTFAASENLATKNVEKLSDVPTLVEAVVAKPQAPLEWYNKAVNIDTFRATNTSPNLPIQQIVQPPLPALAPLATEVAVSGKHRFAEAITAQIKSVDVTQERTHIALNPRGLGSIDIEISQSADNTLKVTIRAENPVVLQALRDERNLLAQAIGFESGATLEFHQQTRDDQAGTGNSDQGSDPELLAGEAKGEMSVKEKVEVIARNQLDITT
jgi:hypothetical protein